MRRTRPAALALAAALLSVSLPLVARADPPQYSVLFLDEQPGYIGGIMAANGVCGGHAFGQRNTGTVSHVMEWDLATGVATDLTPSSDFAYANSASQSYIAGASGGPTHATLWNRQTGVVTDLHEWGVTTRYSLAYGVTDTYVVGQSVNTGSLGEAFVEHAALWDIASHSYFDLTPNSPDISIAYGVEGSLIVGNAADHAYAWDTTTHLSTDIPPTITGIDFSSATCVGPTYIGGNGRAAGSPYHALLWDRATLTARDLNPAGATFSTVVAVNSTFAAGSAAVPGGASHATLWDLVSGSSYDLQTFFGEEYAGYTSRVVGMDSDGNIVGSLTDRSGSGSNGHVFVLRPIVASAVPEAGSGALLGLAGALGAASFLRPLRRRRRQTKMRMCMLPS